MSDTEEERPSQCQTWKSSPVLSHCSRGWAGWPQQPLSLAVENDSQGIAGPSLLVICVPTHIPSESGCDGPNEAGHSSWGVGGQILPLDEVAGALRLPLTKSGNGDSNGTIEHVTPEETEGR